MMIAIVGIVVTLAEWLGTIGTVVAVIGLLSILAHLASTAIGGQLRTNGTQPSPRNASNEDSPATNEPRWVQPMRTDASDFAPATQLSHRKPLDKVPIVMSCVIGATTAALIGGTMVAMLTWQTTTVMNVLFGATSSAVLGGLFSFWASSFFQVARGAWSQAHKNMDR